MFLVGRSTFHLLLLYFILLSTIISGMTPTCVETPPTQLPSTILPTNIPTKQPKIEENESVVPCAGVLQYEPDSGRITNVVYDRCQPAVTMS